jgi:glycosyltransferase involved in cell wall biosynthesis
MRIGIDAGPLCNEYSGIPRAIGGILRALQQLDQENDYTLYSRYDFNFSVENPRWRKCIHPRVPFLLGGLYLKSGMRSVNGEADLDVFWMTRPYAFPYGLPPTTARVTTVYDLVWLLYPRTMELRNRVVFGLFAERAIRQAHRVISISESTRQGLVETVGTPRDKIEVVPLAASAGFAPRDRIQSSRFIAEKYGVSPNYICTVGSVEPRKNLVTLIAAMKILRDRGQLRHQLLIGGALGWKNSNIYAAVERCGLTERELKFLGRVAEEDLQMLYSGAALFVFPSLYEGFGLPLVEAMASGVPIVASNASSVPEVVRDAGILVSPQRPEEFARAIARVTGDVMLSRALAEKGVRRAREFTWEASALKVRRILEGSARATRLSRPSAVKEGTSDSQRLAEKQRKSSASHTCS